MQHAAIAVSLRSTYRSTLNAALHYPILAIKFIPFLVFPLLASSQENTIRVVTEIQDTLDGCSTLEMRITAYIYREKLHLDYSCETFPWIRAQQMVKQGLRDALITIPTEERKAYATASALPVLMLQMRLYFWSQSPHKDSLVHAKRIEDLLAFTFVGQAGSGWAKEHIVNRGIRAEWTQSIETVFGMLSRGRGDFTIQAEIVAAPILAKSLSSVDIASSPIIMNTTGYHLMISKRSPLQSTLTVFDTQLKAMTSSGELKSITEKLIKESVQIERMRTDYQD